jgi:nitrite reductase/ring-hydroxylating ferredoxin subunit
VRVNETDIALFRLELKGDMGSKLYATQLTCPHMGADLTKGAKIMVTDVEDLVIECPLHHYRFDIKTGKLASDGIFPVGYSTDRNQQVGILQTYPVRINGESELVEIGFEALNPLMFSPDFD